MGTFLGVGPKREWGHFNCPVDRYYFAYEMGPTYFGKRVNVNDHSSNVVTAWSWKGTNMLGIGLHSYGFTEKTFLLVDDVFVSQFAIVLIGLLPQRYWLSFQDEDAN